MYFSSVLKHSILSFRTMMNFVLTNVLRTKLTGLSLGCFSSYTMFINILFTSERLYLFLVKRAAKAHLGFWPIFGQCGSLEPSALYVHFCPGFGGGGPQLECAALTVAFVST